MNSIFRQLTGFSADKPKKEKRTYPITFAFKNGGEFIGQLIGDNVEDAKNMYPDAEVLNIKPVRGRTKVVRLTTRNSK